MSLTDQELTRLFDGAFGDDAPGEELWEATRSSMRRRLRARRAATVTGALALVLVVVAAPQILLAQRTTSGIDFAPADEPEPEPAPSYIDKPLRPSPSPSPSAVDAAPSPEPAPEPQAPRTSEKAPTPAAEPARVEVRDYRLVLLDANGAVVRTLYGDYDPARDGLEYGMGDVALRPTSTTRDLVVTFTEGDEVMHHLRLLVVRDGGPAQVTTLSSMKFEDTDRQYTAVPAAAWSPDGAFVAWLQPDAANRPVLKALRWADGAPAGEATPSGGSPIDAAGVAQDDGARGLRVRSWQTNPEQLAIDGYRSDATKVSYVLPISRNGGQLQHGSLSRVG